jgi:hypothetical protein
MEKLEFVFKKSMKSMCVVEITKSPELCTSYGRKIPFLKEFSETLCLKVKGVRCVSHGFYDVQVLLHMVYARAVKLRAHPC